jgi:hypothetical protein
MSSVYEDPNGLIFSDPCVAYAYSDGSVVIQSASATAPTPTSATLFSTIALPMGAPEGSSIPCGNGKFLVAMSGGPAPHSFAPVVWAIMAGGFTYRSYVP